MHKVLALISHTEIGSEMLPGFMKERKSEILPENAQLRLEICVHCHKIICNGSQQTLFRNSEIIDDDDKCIFVIQYQALS